ncbi:Hmo1 protein [Pichia kluyveri]|uniref:Hmo1 protein n=1 Tax=Pichia kluyveri TaxID=36015 RepID=A0AAV5R496_PICKL|nr:Hmo1 protein [Pichia kluyveri]
MSTDIPTAKEELINALKELSKASLDVSKKTNTLLSLLDNDNDNDDGSNKKKRRIKRDPNAPKKPLTSYILFYNHLRGAVAAKDSSLSQTDIAKEISKQWKEMSDDDKSYWRQLYEDDKLRYDTEMIQYRNSLNLNI